MKYLKTKNKKIQKKEYSLCRNKNMQQRLRSHKKERKQNRKNKN